MTHLGAATVAWTARADGDFRRDAVGLEERRRAVVDRPWSVVRQVHGADVLVADEPGAPGDVEGDALVTARDDLAVAVMTADCVPLAIVGTTGPGGPAVVAAVHAGWRGLVAGVVERAAETMRSLGARRLVAAVGPHVRPECYEFDGPALATVTSALGDGVRSTTTAGTPALDLDVATAVVLERAGVELVEVAAGCTACTVEADGTPAWFSHRARGDVGRQATAVWVGP